MSRGNPLTGERLKFLYLWQQCWDQTVGKCAEQVPVCAGAFASNVSPLLAIVCTHARLLAYGDALYDMLSISCMRGHEQSGSAVEPFSESAAHTSTDWVPRGHLRSHKSVRRGTSGCGCGNGGSMYSRASVS